MAKRSTTSPELETFKNLLEADAALFQAANRLRSLELEEYALRVDEVRETIADEFGAIQSAVYKKISRSARSAQSRLRARIN